MERIQCPNLDLPRKPSKTAAYENFAYIDWLRESVHHMSISGGKKWLVLTVVAVLTGYITVLIDLISVLLNDLRKGMCFSKLARWSLLDPYLSCPAEDWQNWSQIFGLEAGVFSILVDFPIYTAFVCVFALSAAWIVINRAPLIKQSGIPETKLIVAGLNYNMEEYLGLRALFYKTCGLALVVSSGLWLGKEGPLVHIASCVSSIVFNQVLGKNASEGLRRELLSAAAATGIAAAFKSPLGGVFFVVELLPSYFNPTKIMWNSFFSATITVVVMSGFKLFTDGKLYKEEDLFHVLFGNVSWMFLETVPFVLLGLAGGLYGHLFSKTYLKFSGSDTRKRFQARIASVFGANCELGRYLEILVVALITALLLFLTPLTKLPLLAFSMLLFKDCPENADLEKNATNFMCLASDKWTAVKLGFIFIQGFILAAYSFSLPLPGGILLPSMALGGTLGRLVGIVCHAIQNHYNPEYLGTCTASSCLVSPSSYAVVGAAAFISGITKLTLTVVLILFELTGAVTYVLPIMIAVMTAKFFSDWLTRENIYDAWLRQQINLALAVPGSTSVADVNAEKGSGLVTFERFSANFKSKLPDVPVSCLMIPLSRTRTLEAFPSRPLSLGELHSFLAGDTHEGYPVITTADEQTFVGYLPRAEIYLRLAESLGMAQTVDTIVSLRIALPVLLAQRQKEYEKKLPSSTAVIPVDTNESIFVVRDSTSLKQVIEMFERMNLNYLVLTKGSKMSGFIDRFVLTRLIELSFALLNNDASFFQTLDEFEISDSE